MFLTGKVKDVVEAVLLFITLNCGFSYNLDTEFPVVFSGSKGSYFGFTTALYHNRWGPLVLVGAPKSNTTTFSNAARSVYQPGTLFRCNITEKLSCREVLLMREGAEQINYDSQYRDLKDGMWLGVSLDVGQIETQKNIVTCGHLWRNRFHPRYHLVNGVCYLIDGDFDTNSIKLLPLVARSKQYGALYGVTEYNYAHGQAGMSAVFTEDGSNLILGAPGIWSWKGSIVDYSVKLGPRRNVYENPSVPSPLQEVQFGSYFGYSVTTGNFVLSDKQMYAVGAPRDGTNGGKVYIIRMDNKNSMIIRMRRQGFQLGEYFGASVLGVDLNGDSRTDLLVGAPMNSQDLGGDEGKVYVYISNGKDLLKKAELTGDRKVSARFGTALANVEDLNQDGYNDVAVGAPYEDGHGAVYIYHGSKSGIQSEYAQKIEALRVNSQLSGFGIHVSRGHDIDDNGYPDLIVGSYRSSQAVLFRSRPVIKVFPEIIFVPKQISMNKTCLLKEQNLICVQVDACLRYTGNHVLPSLKFVFTLNVIDSRGFFSQDSRNKSSWSREKVDVSINDKICKMFCLYLRATTTDFLTPIPVQFSSRLVPPIDFDKKFNKNFAIYHPDSPTNITAEIPFQTGCGEEGVCDSNLMVSAIRTEPIGGGIMTLGEFSRVSVTVTVRNEGEPAYSPELLISIPSEMSSINVEHVCKSDNQRYNTSLVCSIGNLLENNTQVDVHLKLDATGIPPYTKYLEIGFQAVTKSFDIDPSDNYEVLPLHLETVADFGVAGFSSHEQVIYDGKNNLSPIITHTYTVRNYGPSPLQTIDFELQVPYAFLTSDGLKKFLSVSSLKVDNGMQLTIPAICDDIELKSVDPIKQERQEIINDESLLSENDKDTSVSYKPENIISSPSGLIDEQQVNLESDQVQTRNISESFDIIGQNSLNCDTNEDVECVTLRCTAAPFINLRRFAQVSLDLELDFDVLNDQLGKWDQIEFVTSASISVPDTAVKVLNNHPKSTHVRTVASHEGPLPPKEVSLSILLISIGVGALLLVIILIILIKVGFFKRKEKDQIKLLKRETKMEMKKNEQDIEDTEVLSE